jgi:predicted PurR-regulated permease PerM
MNQNESRFYRRVFGLATAALLGFALFKILEPFIGPMLWALLLAFLLFPVNQVLRRWVQGYRGAAAILLTFVVTLLLIIPASLLAAVFTGQASQLIGLLQEAAGRYHIAQASDLLRVPILDRAIQGIVRLVPVTAEQIQGWIVEAGRGLLQILVSTSASFFAGALRGFVDLILTLFLLFFFLRDGEEIVQGWLLLVPMEAERKARLVEHLAAVTRAVVVGLLVTSIVQGTLVGVAFVIVGLPSPVVFGVLAAVVSLLPLVGTALVWAPAALVLALQGRWGAAIFLVVWGVVVVSSADNFIRPLLISGRAQISTLPIFLGLLGGVFAFGAIGMFLGPVLVALVLALMRFAEEARVRAESP